MEVKLWGTRGSIPSPGPETIRYGGNTSCVGVTLSDGSNLNHIELRISQAQVDVYATDAGTTSPLHHIAVISNPDL